MVDLGQIPSDASSYSRRGGRFTPRYAKRLRPIRLESVRTGRFAKRGEVIWRLPATGGEPVPITRSGGIAAIEGTDGFLYYARAPRSPTSIWRMPISGGKEMLVAEGVSYSSNSRSAGRPSILFPGMALPRIRP